MKILFLSCLLLIMQAAQAQTDSLIFVKLDGQRITAFSARDTMRIDTALIGREFAAHYVPATRTASIEFFRVDSAGIGSRWRIEGAAPFSLAGDVKGKFSQWDIPYQISRPLRLRAILWAGARNISSSRTQDMVLIFQPPKKPAPDPEPEPEPAGKLYDVRFFIAPDGTIKILNINPVEIRK